MTEMPRALHIRQIVQTMITDLNAALADFKNRYHQGRSSFSIVKVSETGCIFSLIDREKRGICFDLIDDLD